MAKSPEAFRTITEVAEWLGVQAHVLRFWESRFAQVKPVKRAGGRRYYRPNDMRLLGGIKKLLHDDGLTIKGVQRILREQGVAHVASLSQDLEVSAAPDLETGSTVVRFQDKRQPEAAPAQIDMELEGAVAERENAAPERTKAPVTAAKPAAPAPAAAPGGETSPDLLARLWAAEQISADLLRQMAPIARDLRNWLDSVETRSAG
ncbi:MerR family transcriptional regulator [Ruegeria marisrubri]|uniref:MerR family transcriptional regulator n=1 Tax=Ruegeria marisrubri TaxID=1685379 RepID=A0A0X3TYN5_9RHOB|nr:MerR family transcriptional regulator [Ruegeria marisrubri]KUJ80828.1 MerR family transcriptional regulator [Ruegeria marisrubri]